jgi:hypothetical protein
LAWTEHSEGAITKSTGTDTTEAASGTTVYVASTDVLRMFGPDSSDLDVPVSFVLARSDASVPDAVNLYYHLYYIESLDSAGDYQFHFEDSATVYQTNIPTHVRGTDESPWWYAEWTYHEDGSHSIERKQAVFDVTYWDPSLVRVPAEHGGGWLMIMLRKVKLAADVSESGADEDVYHDSGPGQCIADVVCFYTPEDEPTFATADTVGPFWLVDSTNAVHDDLAAAGTSFRAWLGVPSGIVKRDEADGEDWLYV